MKGAGFAADRQRKNQPNGRHTECRNTKRHGGGGAELPIARMVRAAHLRHRAAILW